MIKFLFLVFTLLFGFMGATHAQSDPLAKCIAENTMGDRTVLVHWLVVATGSHPELRGLVRTSKESTDEANKTMGALVTRLWTENCADEFRTAVKNGDQGQAMHRAFEELRKLAVMRLTLNGPVTVSMADFWNYVDEHKIAASLSGK